jgi:hypothetical protein
MCSEQPLSFSRFRGFTYIVIIPSGCNSANTYSLKVPVIFQSQVSEYQNHQQCFLNQQPGWTGLEITRLLNIAERPLLFVSSSPQSALQRYLFSRCLPWTVLISDPAPSPHKVSHMRDWDIELCSVTSPTGSFINDAQAQ